MQDAAAAPSNRRHRDDHHHRRQRRARRAPTPTRRRSPRTRRSVFTVANFGFTDPIDSADTPSWRCRSRPLPAAGTLTLNGVAVTAGQSIRVADITPGISCSRRRANANGTAYASFTFQVQDNGGTANGGVDLDRAPTRITINVTSVNDAPAGTNNTVTTARGRGTPSPPRTSASPIRRRAGQLACRGDDHHAAAGGHADAQRRRRSPPGRVRRVGRHHRGQARRSRRRRTPTARPTPASPSRCRTTAARPTAASTSTRRANTITVNVTAVNDAPAGTDTTVTTNEDAAHVFTAADFGFTDPNDTPAQRAGAVRITTLPAAGTLHAERRRR